MSIHSISFTIKTNFPISAEKIYRSWLTGSEHAKMTGAKATGTPQTETEFTAWDGYIFGKNLHRRGADMASRDNSSTPPTSGPPSAIPRRSPCGSDAPTKLPSVSTNAATSSRSTRANMGSLSPTAAVTRPACASPSGPGDVSFEPGQRVKTLTGGGGPRRQR